MLEKMDIFQSEKEVSHFIGRKRGVNTRLPRGQELWDTETRGHDIFKVHSKWKADEPDPEELTSMTHPHLTYRKMLRKRSQM